MNKTKQNKTKQNKQKTKQKTEIALKIDQGKSYTIRP